MPARYSLKPLDNITNFFVLAHLEAGDVYGGSFRPHCSVRPVVHVYLGGREAAEVRCAVKLQIPQIGSVYFLYHGFPSLFGYLNFGHCPIPRTNVINIILL